MTRQQLGQDDSYLALTIDVGKAGAEAAYRAKFGRDPQEVLFAGTCYLAGPIPSPALIVEPQVIDVGETEAMANYEQGRLI